jgi:hypothetical protein
MFDLINKINECLQDFQIFPTAFGIGFNDLKDSFKAKTRRAKMVSLSDFNKDNVR